MPADFSQYVDLTVFDAQPGDIYLEAIELARTTLPEFNLRVGTPEDAIFQAMAYMSSLVISSINRVPDRLMEGIVSMMGLSRQVAVPAEIDVTVTIGNYSGGTVPAGTVFSYETLFEDEVQQYVFQTVEAILIPEVELPEPGDDYPSASVQVVALSPGVIPPITTPGTQLTVLSAGTNILSVETFDNFRNGINGDNDYDYLSRATTFLRSLSSAITKSTQADSFILSNYPETVTRVKTYDLTYGEDGLGDISVKRAHTIQNTFLLDDLATVETGENHLFVVGDVVSLYDCGEKFNGERTITATSDTTFSFVSVDTNSGSTAVSGTASAGVDVTGNITIFGYGINSLLTSTEKQNIFYRVSEKAVAGLNIYIRDPDLLQLNVTSSIVLDPTYEQIELESSIENIVANYLSPIEFPYTEDRVRKTRLISLISNIPGVVYVQSLSLSPLNNGWLPQFDDDLIFLNKGSLPFISVEELDFTYTLAPE
jgi:hypothetical protein